MGNNLTLDDFTKGGEILQNFSITDEELLLAIETTERTLAYLEGRGQFFGLVTFYLRLDLNRLNDYKSGRNLK